MNVDRFVGSQVAGYRVESVLGRGAMGVVYLARQRSPDRKVALKLINPAFADDDSFRSRFLRESTAAAAIDHPHILPVYAAGESDGVLFIAMRFIEGRDLRDILRMPDRLDLERVVTIVGQVGGALDAAHARGLVHRDVKPGNILVAREAAADDTDFCYLTDFGVSTWTTSSAGTLTSTGHLVGSLNYAAPEQIEGMRVDGKADDYSLGCVLYECLTGRPPFAGRSAPGILHAHLHEEPPPPTSLRPDLAPAVDAVVGRALKKKPEERYGSCRELTLDLRAALEGGTVAPTTRPSAAAIRPAGPRKARARTFWVAAAAVATAVLVAVAVLAVVQRNGSTARPSPTGSPTGSNPPLVRAGVQVTASQTAPSSKDASGNVVTYLPINVIDGDVQTAWRTPGNGRRETLTLLFDTPLDIVRVGLIPGYAKFDAQTGTNRFVQNRIIERVRYLIPGLAPMNQTFEPVPVPQYVHVGATTSRITVEILDTTEPGGGKDYDFTAISEIYVYGYPQ